MTKRYNTNSVKMKPSGWFVVVVFCLFFMGLLPNTLLASEEAAAPTPVTEENETLYYKVFILGVPAGFARLEYKGVSDCSPTDGQKQCYFFRYSVNLNKLKNILGKMTIVSDVYLRTDDLAFVQNTTITQTGFGRAEIVIQADEQNKLLILQNNDVVLARLPLEQNVQTLASLPLYLRLTKKLGTFSLPVLVKDQIEFITFDLSQKGERITVTKDKKEFLIFYGKTWLPVYVLLLPIEILGAPIGDITAEHLQKSR